MSNNLINLLMTRRSIRKYSSKKISKKLIIKILNTAIWAPSAHNSQPWRFIIIIDSNLKLNLSKAMSEEWIKDMVKDGVSSKVYERVVRSSVEMFTHAPVIILACLTMEDTDRYPDSRRNECEYVMAIQSLAASVQNMILAAHSEGLGSCWFCAPLFCKDIVKRILKLPDYIEPQILITMGFSGENPSIPTRKSIEEVSFLNFWGEKL